VADIAVVPVAPLLFVAFQTPAVVKLLEPVANGNLKYIPVVLSVAQVPEVSPGTVIVFCSQVFALLMV
jgi:hypothetical protein